MVTIPVGPRLASGAARFGSAASHRRRRRYGRITLRASIVRSRSDRRRESVVVRDAQIAGGRVAGDEPAAWRIDVEGRRGWDAGTGCELTGWYQVVDAAIVLEHAQRIWDDQRL